MNKFKALIAPAYYKILNIYDAIFHSDIEFLPPRGIRFVGNGDFIKTGNEFVEYFINKAGLKPEHHVLDLGCGIGRMAIPLTKYLNKEGSFEGFDIAEKGIEWCQKNITPKYPNFRFQVADLYNKLYHPKGKYLDTEYKFPYKNNAFDFVYLTSVFTHMLSGGVENYMSEISRVLKPSGRCLITFFILNEESEQLIKEEKSVFSFKNDHGIYRVQNAEVPEDAIAYQEDYLRNLFSKNSIRIKEPVHFGAWCGRSNYLSFQDIVIAEKQQ